MQAGSKMAAIMMLGGNMTAQIWQPDISQLLPRVRVGLYS
jgi:hypothetical protein